MKQVFYLLMIMAACGCGKSDQDPDPAPGNTTFWTTQQGNWNLILDGVEYGKLKRATQMPVCGDPDFQNYSLSPGTHTADAKNLDGFAWGDPITFTVPAGGCIQVKLPQ